MSRPTLPARAFPRVRLPTLILAALIASAAIAQYALDSNLSAQHGRINVAAPRLRMGDEIYTVSGAGHIVHNRASAFRDNSYQIYQSRSIDRFRFQEPVTSARRRDASAASMLNSREYAIRSDWSAAGARPSASRSYSPGPSMSSSRSTTRSGSYSLARPTYSAARAPLTPAPLDGATRVQTYQLR